MSEPLVPILCLGCHARIAGDALVCPHCATLVHRDRLANLAGLAAEAEAKGNPQEAAARYAQMLPLLPPKTAQAETVRKKLNALRGGALPASAESLAAGAPPEPFHIAGWVKKGIGALGAAILLGWKFKFALFALLGKGKLLLLGLTKFSTVASMLAFLGVYWNLYGFPFALGLVLLIYVHEMGHVWAAKQIGVPVTAPMFIPGFGAFIGLRTRLANPAEEAYLGLAGPIWGVTGALVAVGLWAVSQQPLFLVIGVFAALMNLFNLIPVWQLDGAHAFRAFSNPQRWMAMVFPLLIAAVAWDGMLLMVSAGAAYQLFWRKGAPSEGHRPSLLQFCALVLVVAAILRVGAPVLHPESKAPSPGPAAVEAPTVTQPSGRG